MELRTERVGGLGGITVIENRKEKFFSLDNILDALGRTTTPCGTEHEPVRLEARIAFGYVMRGGDLVHSVFIDRAGMEKLIGNTADGCL